MASNSDPGPGAQARGIIPAALLALVGVLAVAAHQLQSERARITQEYLQMERTLALEASQDLAERLNGLAEDARLVAGFVERTDDAVPQPAAQLRIFRAASEALVTVVRPYRRISVHGPDGSELASAIDATPGVVVPAGIVDRASIQASREALASGSAVMRTGLGEDAPALALFAQPTSESRAVVIVLDQSVLLSTLLRSRGFAGRFVVVDPSMAAWRRCTQPEGCIRSSAVEWSLEQGLRSLVDRVSVDEGVAIVGPELSADLLLPAGDALSAWRTVRDPTGGRWSVVTVLSMSTIDAAESAVIRQLAVVAVTIALALSGLAFLIVRQQRRNTLLAVRLLHAQDLARMRERSDLIINQVPVGILGVTADGRIAFANRFLEERLGPIERDSVMQSTTERLPPDIALRIAPLVEGAIRDGRPALLKPGADSDENLEVRVVPVAPAMQDVAAMVLVEDRTMVRNLEKQLVRAEKLATVGVLTAGIAHEIGTPLGIIRGRAELLLERANAGPMAHDLGMITSQIDRITGIIRQLLDFASAQPVDRLPVDVGSAAHAVAQLVEHRFRSRRVELRVEIPDDMAPLAANPDQLQQVLLNLLLNACDACGPGGHVTLRAHANGNRTAHLDVLDDGCGIPAENLNAVFDPFFTTKKRGEGTGLGLPVAASIVRNHGGEISLGSEPGVGTHVTVVWPLGA